MRAVTGDRLGFPNRSKKIAVRISVGASASATLVLVTITRRLPAMVSNWADAARDPFVDVTVTAALADGVAAIVKPAARSDA